jgi:pimeloyl-ACP methyl ester carboxylesterase
MAGDMSYEEFPLHVPSGDEWLGAVLSAPTGEARDLAVLFLPGGNATRAHRNGMWTRTARILAERGFPSLRLDYHGSGDSTGRVEMMDLEAPFVDDALAGAALIRRALSIHKIAIVTTCYGGRAGIGLAGRDETVVGAVFFRVPIKRGGRRTQPRQRSKLKRWLLVRTRSVRWVLGRRIRPRLAALLRGASTRGAGTDNLDGFRRRGEIWLLAFRRPGDPFAGEKALLADLGAPRAALHEGRVHVQILEGGVLHGFRSLAEQEVGIRAVVDAVESTYASLGGTVPVQQPT